MRSGTATLASEASTLLCSTFPVPAGVLDDEFLPFEKVCEVLVITHGFQVSAAAAATLHARPAKVGETLPFLSFCDKICRFSKSDAFYQRSLLQESPGASIIVDPGNQSVSLTCPISLQRQVVPVRTLLCQHVETFDLENFISAIPSKFSY